MSARDVTLEGCAVPDDVAEAITAADRARMACFWRNEAKIPDYLMKSVTMRGTCYPDSTESEPVHLAGGSL